MDQGLIQILGLRPHFKNGKETKFDAFHEKNWRAPSVPELFQNLESYVEKIPEPERWNIYYTALHCGAGKREWAYQEIIPFDVDNIDTEQVSAYHDVILKVLGVKWEETGVVFSGNGLQYIIGLKERITDAKYFDETRRHYKAICAKLNHALALAHLPGSLDPSVHSLARLLRLPGTLNRKPGRERRAELLQRVIVPTDFSLVERSGLPSVVESDQISPRAFKRFGKPDTSAVLSGCEFLKHAKAHPEKINEPEWYAALSVLGHLENGVALAHEYSQGHKGYSHAETEEKLAQAIEASGPRTCKNIDALWGKCSTCPYNHLVNSPISITGPDHIRTAESGFHDVSVDPKTGALKGKPRPNYEDLRKFFEKENPYKVLGGSKIVYTWNGKKYAEMADAYLESFAQTHFNPKADTHMRSEFKNLVQVTNIESEDWWERSTQGAINFQNGVLDLRTMALGPHSPDIAFRYILDYDYDAQAQCPTWMKFMHDITLGDVSLQQLLMEFAGYALSSDSCWAQTALVLEGHGSNGKSTFMNVLRALAGRDNYASLTLSDLRAEGNRQMLDGKLFNMAEETPSRSLMESSIFKNLVSGGETQVRQLYKKPYVMRNRAKLIFACNELPGSSDTTHGFFRRLLIVPFRATFSDALGNKDPFIEEKLLRELPGIFNEAIRGYQRLLKGRAFTKADASHQAVEAYRREQDSVLSWVEDHVQVHPVGASESFSTIRGMFDEYAQTMKKMEIDPLNAVAFGKKIAQLIPEYKSRLMGKKLDGEKVRVLMGVTRQTGAGF